VRQYKRGRSKRAISRDLGVSYPAVCTTIWRYEREGKQTLAPQRRGRRLGSGRVLSQEQERGIRALICEKRPEQLKMNFALWSRPAVIALIEHELDVSLSIRAVGNYTSNGGA
jgi:transposase